MDNDKLLRRLRDWNLPDEDVLGMIFSNYIDIGGGLIGLTVENAIKAGKLLREYDQQKKQDKVDATDSKAPSYDHVLKQREPSNEPVKRTSEEWQKMFPLPKVIYFRGWDHNNFTFSWKEELITKKRVWRPSS